LHTGKITTGHDGWWLVVDTALETSGAPVDELDSTLGLDGGHSGVDVLGDDITTEHHTTGHVLTVTGVTLGKHVTGLEDRVGDLGHRKLLVVCLLSRDDGGKRGKHKVNTRIGSQVGLELGKIHVQGTIETKRRSKRRHNLGNKSVKVGVCGALDVERTTAHVIKSLVIDTESAISVLKK
jgi:hypothetical protein